MTDRGIMVVDQDQAEPIIPMCCMVEKLGYTVTWTQGGMKLSHPSRDEIQVEMRHGCPQMPKRTAMRIIDDLEKGRHVKTLQKVLNEEEEILRGLTEAHPVLRRLPREVRDRLVVAPSETLRGLPGCNRSRRKLLSEQGFVAHLYAGESDGYTLTRALQEVGGDRRRLVEIDILRQEPGRESHDMTLDHGPYPALLRAAIDGSLKGLVMEPNCRTRSVLRHYPLDVPGGGPRPLRSWDEPWGTGRNTEAEQRKVVEDDVLMWRGFMLYIVGEELRRAMGRTDVPGMSFGVEEPADPTHYMKEVVT